MTKIEKVYRRIREQFSVRLDATFKERFRRNHETAWSFISMQMVSRPGNGKPYTVKQKSWVDGYSTGYHAALEQTHEEAPK